MFNIIKNKKYDGSILLITIIAILLITQLAFSLVALITFHTRIAGRFDCRSKASMSAEAGLADALFQLKADKDWNAGFSNKKLPNTDAYYTITFAQGSQPYSINNVSGNNPVTGYNNRTVPAGCVHIVSEGKYASRTVIRQMICSITSQINILSRW